MLNHQPYGVYTIFLLPPFRYTYEFLWHAMCSNLRRCSGGSTWTKCLNSSSTTPLPLRHQGQHVLLQHARTAGTAQACTYCLGLHVLRLGAGLARAPALEQAVKHRLLAHGRQLDGPGGAEGAGAVGAAASSSVADGCLLRGWAGSMGGCVLERLHLS